jgi:hypothetical protein
MLDTSGDFPVVNMMSVRFAESFYFFLRILQTSQI